MFRISLAIYKHLQFIFAGVFFYIPLNLYIKYIYKNKKKV